MAIGLPTTRGNTGVVGPGRTAPPGRILNNGGVNMPDAGAGRLGGGVLGKNTGVVGPGGGGRGQVGGGNPGGFSGGPSPANSKGPGTFGYDPNKNNPRIPGGGQPGGPPRPTPPPGKPGKGGPAAPGGPAGPKNPMDIKAQDNPYIQALLDEYSKYRGELSNNTDLEGQQAMQRQRDSMTGIADEFGVGASQRGIAGSGVAGKDLVNRIVNPGQQQLGALNASLTQDARQQQLGALGAQSGLATQQAGLTQGQQAFGLEAWKALQQANQAQQNFKLMKEQQSVSQLQALANIMGQFYTGF